MIDVDAIAEKWLKPCGRCDYGLHEFGCSCPEGDYRSVIQDLIEEIEGLRDAGTYVRVLKKDLERLKGSHPDVAREQRSDLLDRAARILENLDAPSTDTANARMIGFWVQVILQDITGEEEIESIPAAAVAAKFREIGRRR